MDSNFWKNKKVLLTGHTGFKGSWLSLWLQKLDVDLIGYSKSIPTKPRSVSLTLIFSESLSGHSSHSWHGSCSGQSSQTSQSSGSSQVGHISGSGHDSSTVASAASSAALSPVSASASSCVVAIPVNGARPSDATQTNPSIRTIINAI